MAQQITYWKMAGKSDIEIKTIRLKNKTEIARLVNEMPIGTDVITLDRSDKQSNLCHEIWHSPFYRDLNER